MDFAVLTSSPSTHPALPPPPPPPPSLYVGLRAVQTLRILDKQFPDNCAVLLWALIASGLEMESKIGSRVNGAALRTPWPCLLAAFSDWRRVAHGPSGIREPMAVCPDLSVPLCSIIFCQTDQRQYAGPIGSLELGNFLLVCFVFFCHLTLFVTYSLSKSESKFPLYTLFLPLFYMMISFYYIWEKECWKVWNGCCQLSKFQTDDFNLSEGTMDYLGELLRS